MSGCALNKQEIQKIVDFHGHWCPGLAIGIRAAELALEQIGPHAADEEVVAVVETDMCGVDAIQYMTGCTVGKGNLIFLDYGKMAFSFFRRSDGKGVRLLLKPMNDGDPRAAQLKAKQATVGLDAQETAEAKSLRDKRAEQILDRDLSELFDSQTLESPAPQKARMMPSLDCAACGESTMESRTRRFGGQTLCIPCFQKRDRRL